jgi:hypothetical protein
VRLPDLFGVAISLGTRRPNQAHKEMPDDTATISGGRSRSASLTSGYFADD